MPFFKKSSEESRFWKWFVAHDAELFDFEADREAVFDRLATALQQVHPDLVFEFGPVSPQGKREFIISAGGLCEAFPAVEALASQAPPLDRWTIIKFRERKDPIFDVAFGPHKVSADEVHYTFVKDDDPTKVGVLVFLDGYDEDDPQKVWKQIGYLFLDQALGEYDVETHLGVIAFFDRQSKYFQHARPIKELAAAFDARLGRT